MSAAPGRSAGSDPHIGQAPGTLATVQAFVNTLDIEQDTDELTSPAALDRWLSRAGLAAAPGAGSGGRSGPADLALALDLREALRGVLRTHVAAAPEPAAGAAARLAGMTAGLQARIAAGPDGSLRVIAGTPGSRGALTQLLLIAAEAETLGTWGRLKVCSADDCQWAFYDRSPARSGCWCSMQICGSRAKSRAYRSRAASGSR